MFPIPAEFNDALLELMKQLLQKYFYTLVQVYCGELQPNVTDSTIYEIKDIIPEVKHQIETVVNKYGFGSFNDLLSRRSKPYSNIQDEHPAIWGPGFTEPPGGPEYRNR